jgi:hypothetical protein
MNEEDKLVIDIAKIQSHVQRECLVEERYQRENSAKFRAIEQKVPTYEDFRQIVLASHLKPLEKGETLAKVKIKNMNTWNTAKNQSTSGESDSNIKNENIYDNKEKLLELKPTNNLEFLKIWRILDEKYDAEAKWVFLQNVGVELTQKIFAPEINGDILGKFIKLFAFKLSEETNSTEMDAKLVVDFMNCFTRCQRFSLNKMFLKKEELQMCQEICVKLDKQKEKFDENDLQKLKSSYL